MGSKHGVEGYEVVWPLASTTSDRVTMSTGLDSLEGARVGFVWDHVFRGDEMFALLERELQQKYPTATFVGHEAFGNVHGQDEPAIVAALPGKLKAERVDAVIVGVGA
jgi:hypothetical protein